MVSQDQSSSAMSSAFVSSGNGGSFEAGVQSVAGEGLVPKIRKPYTITKQRERWTEEEHKKFIEAVKLYGRAWKKIEDYVGTKTAVQIRSHAQKFFHKVERETNKCDEGTIESIEIPPPRPKRKPMHPYPRKLVLSGKKEAATEQGARSVSPNSSLSEQGNQSPISVLSAVVSDTAGSADPATPTCSPPPVSSVDPVNQVAILPSKYDAQEEDVPNGPVSVKLELFPDVDAFDKEEPVPTKVLKLFGKDVVIPANSSDSTCKSDVGEGDVENPSPIGIAYETSGNSWTSLGDQVITTNVEKPIPLPWWVFFKGMPVDVDCNDEEKVTQREGSSEGSNSGSADAEAFGDKNWDVEAQSGQSVSQSDDPNPEKKPTLLNMRASFDKGMRGFVPYKRCLSDRDMQSSSITSEDRKVQRIRLCL